MELRNMSESEQPNVVLVAEDELIMEKLQKYHPGTGFGIIGSITESEHVKIHTEILNDWYDKGYTWTNYRVIGSRKRFYLVFTKRD